MKNYVRSLLIALSFTSVALTVQAQEITTVAGIGILGFTGNTGPVPALGAELDWPESVALDSLGNLFIADANNNVIRKVTVTTGLMSIVAGNGYDAGSGNGAFSGDGGPATAATLFFPTGITLDTLGRIFIADRGNNCIRKVDTSGKISTVAGIGGAGYFGYSGDGGAATAAQMYWPTRVAIDRYANLYIADSYNSAIREVNNVSGVISTIAGTGVTGYGGDDGPATAAQLSYVNDVAVDTAGNVYIADTYNSRIRMVDLSGNITTIAGTGISGYSGDGGPATAADMFEPSGIAVDDSGDIYFSDQGNNNVRMIDTVGNIWTLAGIDTPGYNGDGIIATSAKLWYPEGLTVLHEGKYIYIADRGNFRVREIVPHAYTGINNIAQAQAMSVYPNPASGAINIKISSSIVEPVRIVITSITGQQVTSVEASTNTVQNMNLALPAGMYFISASTAHGVMNEKLVAE